MARRGQWALALAGLVTLLRPFLAQAQERPYDWGGGMHPMSGMWGAWGLGMMLIMLLFWAAVIVASAVGIRWLISRGRESRPADTALDILRQRYARGDIGKEECDARKRDLT